VLDANAKIPEGFLNGNTFALGSYSSCLDIKVDSHKHNQTMIEGFQ
jgi:hypothetical protein